MTRPLRTIVFAAGAIALTAAVGTAIRQLPGPHPSPYAEAINQTVVSARHTTDAVSAVNFDYRAVDTLGEESILFVAVIGALVLLREAEETTERGYLDAVTSSRLVAPTDAVRLWTLALTGPIVVFGIDVVVHGQLTPGGGFQGGVVLASAPLLIYLADSYDVFRRVTSHALIEMSEAAGVLGFLIVGIGGATAGGAFLQNVLPLGPVSPATIASGGTIPCLSLAAGLAVSGGFTLLLSGFLQQALAREE